MQLEAALDGPQQRKYRDLLGSYSRFLGHESEVVSLFWIVYEVIEKHAKCMTLAYLKTLRRI